MLRSSMDGLMAEPRAMIVQAGTAQLVIIDTVNRVIVVDLTVAAASNVTPPTSDACVHHARVAEGQVLTLELGPPGSQWVYLGCRNGRVAVFHVGKRWMSPYLIMSQATLSMAAVVAIAVHPHTSDMLLVVYFDGSAVIWDLLAKKPHLRLGIIEWGKVLPAWTYPTHATTACWHPDGQSLALGYDNGWIAVWNVAVDGSASATPVAPVAVLSVAAAVHAKGGYGSAARQAAHGAGEEVEEGAGASDQDPPCAVFKLVWALEGPPPTAAASPGQAALVPGSAAAASATALDRAVLYVGGGLSDYVIARLEFPRGRCGASTSLPSTCIRHSPVFGLVQDFVVLSSSPWHPRAPRAVLTLSDHGNAMAYAITAAPTAGGTLRQHALPLSVALASMGQVSSIQSQWVSPEAMNELMDLEARTSRLVSALPLDWAADSARGFAPGSAPLAFDEQPRIPEHALMTVISETGVHVLDLTSSPPTVLSGLFVAWELLKAVVVDNLPPDIAEDPSLLAEWYPGLQLAWAVTDWTEQRMVIGCTNGVLIEMLCRKQLLAGTGSERDKRVRVQSLDALMLSDHGELLDNGGRLRPLSRLGSVASGEKSPPPSGRLPEKNIHPEVITSGEDISTWIPLTLSRTQFKGFGDHVFLPFKMMVPAVPTESIRGTLCVTMLAVMAASGTVDVYDLRSEAHVANIALAPLCTDIAAEALAETAKKAGNKLLSRNRMSLTALDKESGPSCSPTAIKWAQTFDGTLRLFVGCSGHVFVYALEDESVTLQTCLRDRGDVPVLDILTIPDADDVHEAPPPTEAESDAPEPTGLAAAKGEKGSGYLVPLHSSENGPRRADLKPTGDSAPLEQTHAVVTRDSIRVLDCDEFTKLHSWKPSLERHGHIIHVRYLNAPPQAHLRSRSSSRASSSRRPSPSRPTPDDALHQLMVMTDVAVVVLSYPYLDLVADMSHGIKAIDFDRLTVTRDGHIVHIEGANRVHVLGCRTDTSWAVHPSLSFVRPRIATATPSPTSDQEDASEGGVHSHTAASSSPSSYASTPSASRPTSPAKSKSPARSSAPRVGGGGPPMPEFLDAIPPRPVAPPSSVIGSIMSMLPFGGSSAADGAGSSVQQSEAEVASQRRLNEAFGVIDVAATEAGQAAQRALNALHLRGEKLEMLEQKFSDLNENTSQFAALAKKIREQEEKKKWFHF
ncbi:hypothetical protein BC828DRAFT_375529 [Blastocladiella britannica]|nr:hypothetical protein BC828DRAFT_375529 [Blastocladiella britannica]